MRHRPFAPSADQRWRNTCPVAGLIPVPDRMMPACGVPTPEANCIVVWPVAALAASAIITGISSATLQISLIRFIDMCFQVAISGGVVCSKHFMTVHLSRFDLVRPDTPILRRKPNHQIDELQIGPWLNCELPNETDPGRYTGVT